MDLSYLTILSKNLNLHHTKNQFCEQIAFDNISKKLNSQFFLLSLMDSATILNKLSIRYRLMILDYLFKL